MPITLWDRDSPLQSLTWSMGVDLSLGWFPASLQRFAQRAQRHFLGCRTFLQGAWGGPRALCLWEMLGRAGGGQGLPHIRSLRGHLHRDSGSKRGCSRVPSSALLSAGETESREVFGERKGIQWEPLSLSHTPQCG